MPPIPSDPTAGLANPAQAWTLESCRLIHDASIYPPRRKITDAYLDMHRPLAETRVRLAATRLAGMIEDALAP